VSEITVRVATPYDADGISRVKIDTWRYAYKHILDPTVLKELDVARDSAKWKERLSESGERERCLVACEQDRVVGFLYLGPNRFDEVDCDGELQAIYVLPSHHRRGVGHMMLREGVDWMVADGFKSMAVFVFRDNPIGVGFYRSTGAELHDEAELEIGGKKYPDQCYVWPSLADLQSKLRQGE